MGELVSALRAIDLDAFKCCLTSWVKGHGEKAPAGLAWPAIQHRGARQHALLAPVGQPPVL